MTLLALERVSAADGDGPRGRPRGKLVSVDLLLGAGVHAVLGAPEDGTLALVDVLSGARAPLRGRVSIAGLGPSSSAAARARVGSLGASPRLPDARTVEASVALALAARGDAAGAARGLLASLGLAELAGRGLGGLSFGEARAVEAALCLSTRAPLCLVLHEPLADLGPLDPEAVRRHLVEHARAGACVVATTSAPADARSLADAILILERGRIARSVGGDGAGLAQGSVVPLLVWAQSIPGGAPVRALAAELAGRPEIQSLSFEAPKGPGGLAALRLLGADVDACALVVADCASRAGVIVVAIATAPPSLAEIHAPRPAAPWTGLDLRGLSPRPAGDRAAGHPAATSLAEGAPGEVLTAPEAASGGPG